MNAYTIALSPALEMTDEQFYQLCRRNPDLRFERNPQGDLIIMPPTGGGTGNRNFELSVEFGVWNRRTRLGYLFDSSTGFKLPGGGNRSPDLAWIAAARWEALTPEQQEKFPPIAPDFVLELRSPSDNLRDLQAKMQEYIASGVRLGWLLDRPQRRVEIYRPDQPPELLENPESLESGEVLPGFRLDLRVVW